MRHATSLQFLARPHVRERDEKEENRSGKKNQIKHRRPRQLKL
jgi:hypothetical protein